ncbi:MAG TPA: DNA repair protein RecO [Planctomycetota bacterium]|jgi:DNA repair protein RecO|nr:DNA repair protein RecO [Planctomycetota bacterium]MDP7245221.1 DNA repair protein RecO [Planctomycetota bacterium]HJM40193.1 DNA repair protein RecO [Planctomycetota bacterium]|tara:strand:+ start:27267 stop:28007 length:741 start_codon:yes stop_codon:yes gene_type:complete
MKRQTTPAIVLRRWPWSESSLALRILTPGHGTITLRAKGVYKATSGSMGVLDTWALVEVDMGGPPNSDFQQLYRCRLLDRMSGLSESPEKLAAAGLFGELAELAAPPGQDSGPVFRFLLRTLQAIHQGFDLDGLLCSGLLEALSHLGLDPQLKVEPETTDALWFHHEAGGVLPPNTPRPEGHSRLMSHALRTLLLECPQEPAAAEEADPALLEEAFTILGEFLHFHLERPPRAWNALRHRQAALNR